MTFLVLQEAVSEDVDPIVALDRIGVFAWDSAIHYLSPGQLDCIVNDLVLMEETLAVEAAGWILSSRLSRARRANNKY